MGSSLYNSFLSKNPSHQERLDLGNSIRKQTSRSSLAEFTVKNNRQTPIDILLAQAKTRLQPFIPIRHARMAVNPFAFFRGGAAIMAKDLASVPSPAITSVTLVSFQPLSINWSLALMILMKHYLVILIGT